VSNTILANDLTIYRLVILAAGAGVELNLRNRSPQRAQSFTKEKLEAKILRGFFVPLVVHQCGR